MAAAVVLTVILAVVMLIVALITVTVRARRGRPATPAPAGGNSVPTFQVVALGSRGAGKTLLLASMYQQLQSPRGRSYFLTAPYEQVVLLNRWFTDAADTGKDWPSGTAIADTRIFTFTVLSRAPSGATQPIMGINYLEYAGGLLTDVPTPGSLAQSELLGQIASAHALIGIIDGFRVRQCLDGHGDGQLRLQESLTAMINLMMLTPSPVTFVITKWDLLQDIDVDDDARLRLVRKYLMSNSGFRDLVQAHSNRRVVRLIPVSALGFDFAELDRQGRVVKVPGGRMNPTNVDVPLAAVVPDVFAQIEGAIDKAHLEAMLAQVRNEARLGPANAFAELGTFIGQRASKILGVFFPHAAFVGVAADELFRSGERSRNDRETRLDRQLAEAAEQQNDFQAAHRRVFRELRSRVDVLEGRLPSSRLSGAD